MAEYIYINGIKIYSFPNIFEIIHFALKSNKILIALNSDKISYSSENLKNIINTNIGYCDGIGAVWALRKKGLKTAIKIAGCDLWLELIKNDPSKKIFLIGGKKDVIEKTVQLLRIQFTNINIVGYRDGYFKNIYEEQEIIEEIKEKQPELIFVAMGSPKQEYLLKKIYDNHNVTMMGLGGSFDVYSGKIKRAPKWLIKYNLETIYRYFFAKIKFNRILNDFKFLFMLITNRL